MNRYIEPVTTTLENCGLNLDQAIVFGGSVLAIHGIRKANDVDLLVDLDVFKHIEQASQLPNGQSVEIKETRIRGVTYPPRLVTPDRVTPGGLRVDLSVPYDLEEELAKTDQLTVDGLTLHCRTLAAIRKAKSCGTGRPKDLIDIWKINRHLRSTSV
ncbi:hypothetical protein KC951_00190 [Candidatus Saccharibacteria bacterium]|nr:hypothetical protein [Candidatus Saccharibacteria bacterium]